MSTDKYFDVFILILVVSATIGTIVTSINDANLTGATGTVMALAPLGLAVAILLVAFKRHHKK